MSGYRSRRSNQGPTFKDLVQQDLKNKSYRPVYLLAGDDTHRQEEVVQHIRKHALGPGSADFNFQVYQGDQTPMARILQQAMSLPMFGGTQVIWVRHAEHCVTDQESQDQLETYMASPVQESIVILCFDKVDKRKKWVKASQEHGYLFDFAPPTGNELVTWLIKTASLEGLPLTPPQATLMCELVGNDLLGLKSEVAKLALHAEDLGRALTTEDLDQLIMDQAALQGYEITSNLMPGRAADVLKVWFRLSEWGRSAYEIAPLLISRVRKGAILEACREEGLPDGDICRLSEQSPYALKYLESMVRSMGKPGLRRNLQVVLECDRKLKGSPLKPDIIIEKTILDLCNQNED